MKFRKALHIAQKEFPWLTLKDIMDSWQSIKEVEEVDNDNELDWMTAQAIAEFTCDVIAMDL